MCGIAGFVGKGNLGDLQLMSKALIARGPDDNGNYLDPNHSVYFTHRRLSIIDLADGRQPMSDTNEDVTVTFNGEIYNAPELRELLIKDGYSFKTSHSDTEVLINGYKKWGSDLPKFLNGMFAFAIYDKKNGHIFLSRDRFGEKPLYYYHDQENFIFASELKSLRKHSYIKTDICDIAIQKYFAYGYIPAPLTSYQNCHKLKPGHSLILNIASHKLTSLTYWRFELRPDHHITSESDVVDELDHLLKKSVQSRLVSDVDLGIFLSGGIDSSAILYYATTLLDKKNINTFTIGFNETSFDESSYAKKIAHYFNVKNHRKTLDTNGIKNLIPEIFHHLDEPISDPSIIPTYFLCNHARKHVTTALSGDGGDELFAGYDPFSVLKMANFYDKIIPKMVHQKISNLAQLLPVSHRNLSFDLKAKRGLRGLSYDKDLWNPLWLAPAGPEYLKDLFHKPMQIEDIYSEAITLWNRNNSLDLVDKTLEFYTNLYLPNNILVKSDQASMMNSLEVRSPFLDNDLADFCMKLPNHFKFKNGSKKYILKKLLENKLPKEVLNRKKKGFGLPVAKMLMDYDFKISNHHNNNINLDLLNSAYHHHKNKSQDNGSLIWSYMAIENIIK